MDSLLIWNLMTTAITYAVRTKRNRSVDAETIFYLQTIKAEVN